ncbi:hypothetical protein L3X38_032539 [Prunus dulcis]|uniref:Uncharacterized protein n=1 Tax=Prunus dulcis TaxID=3755 RepID=A0AAD4YV14_PRUDU|nr:hypothetical protein L3X38_032539 [Prunus dulcis]
MYISFSSYFLLFCSNGQLGEARLVVVEQVRPGGPAAAYSHRSRLEHAGPHVLRATSIERRKVDVQSSRNYATALRGMDVSPLRKKPRLPSAEKT